MRKGKRSAQRRKPTVLFDRVVTILEQARSNVVREVNTSMVLAYWLIGREIVEDLQYFGTQSERTLRKIAKPDSATPEGLREIEKLVDALKDELGQDYLDAYKKKGIQDQVIITVQQQAQASALSIEDGAASSGAASGRHP